MPIIGILLYSLYWHSPIPSIYLEILTEYQKHKPEANANANAKEPIDARIVGPIHNLGKSH